MKGLPFKESNLKLGKPASMTDDECDSLEVHASDAHIISCWGGSWKDRLRFLITGELWLWVWSTSGSQPPIAMETTHPWKRAEKESRK